MSAKPIVIKANFQFFLAGKIQEYIHKNVTINGSNGLEWPRGLDDQSTRMKAVGQSLEIHLEIPTTQTGAPLKVRVQAFVNREQTVHDDFMGLAFHLTAEQKNLIASCISRYGAIPNQHQRKYPRIPVDPNIPMFPLKITVCRYAKETDVAAHTEGNPWVMNLVNLSPQGALLMSDAPQQFLSYTNDVLDLAFEGRLPGQPIIHARAVVCRIVDTVHMPDRKPQRLLGLKLVGMDASSTQNFKTLLRDILMKISTSLR